jgi:ATP-dependent helicase/nuclease subunit A
LFDDEFGITLDVEQEETRNITQRVALLRQAQQGDAEDRRLLYVAATRAKDRLVISAHTKHKADGTLALDGWLKVMGAVIGLEGATGDAPVSQLPAIGCVFVPEVTLEAQAEPIVTALTDLSLPRCDLIAPLAGNVPSPIELSQPDRVWRVVPQLDQPRAPAWVVGKLVHAAICRWRFPADAGLDDLLRPLISEAGLIDARMVTDALKRAKHLLRRFQAHPLHAELDAAERYHEVPVQAPAANEEGVLDVLYRMGAGWRVLDFKTDHLPDDIRWQRVRDDYVAQVREYQQAARQLLAQPVEAALVLLDYRRGIEVVDI